MSPTAGLNGGDSPARRPAPVENPLAARILVIDDQPEMLRLMRRALGDSFECEFASDVKQAQEMLSAGSFQLAICNLHEPGRAGLAFAEEIVREYPGTAPVVLMAGEDDPEVAKEAFALGVYGYLVEPFWPGQLLITVLSALRRRELEVIGEELSQNVEDRHQKVIDMAPMPIYAKDTSHRYVVANAKADELAGVKPGHLIGQTDEAIMPPGEAKVQFDIDCRVLKAGITHEAEETVEVGDVKRTFKTVKFPLLDERGRISAVGGISADITAENEAIRLSEELTASQLQAIEELQLSRQETIEGLARAIDLHDSSTGAHVGRMASVAAYLGSQLNLDPDYVELLRAAAPMHDVGKIGTPAEILRKTGLLTNAERSDMERHTVIGHRIFADFESKLSKIAAKIALTHHERWDGTGYPQGLVGEDIPLEGRIVAVADVFDALLSDRSYRPALSVEKAVAIMKEGKGSHFDPRIVDVLIDHLAETLSHRG